MNYVVLYRIVISVEEWNYQEIVELFGKPHPKFLAT
jgi:hypothetical protein